VNPLNDDELNSLLEQARTAPVKAPSTLESRTMKAYRQRFRPSSRFSARWRWAAIAALLLILAGSVATRSTTDVGQEGPVLPYRAEPGAADLTLKDFQPVPAFEPRVVRSMKDDRQ
jgi:hypothetical protein